MSHAIAAMSTWVGALARGGLLMGQGEEEGALLALRVLGEEGLSRLREAFAKRPAAEVARERRGAIHACIWMAQADREIVESEVAMLEEIIAHSDLDATERDDLEAAILEPQHPDRFSEELTQPELRELIVALGWQLAGADGRVDDDELEALFVMCDELDVSRDRAEAIRAALAEAR